MSWWTDPAIVVPAAIAVIGIFVGIYFSLRPRAALDVDNATRCRENHPDATELSIDLGGSRHLFAGCVWPPIPGTDSSGYWTVQVEDFEIPGSYTAQKFTTMQVFITKCYALNLDYIFDSQGMVAHSRFTVDTRQTVSAYDGQAVNLYGEVANPPRAVVDALGTHLIVLSNLRYTLLRVRCADSSKAPPS